MGPVMMLGGEVSTTERNTVQEDDRRQNKEKMDKNESKRQRTKDLLNIHNGRAESGYHSDRFIVSQWPSVRNRHVLLKGAIASLKLSDWLIHHARREDARVPWSSPLIDIEGRRSSQTLDMMTPAA